MPQSIPAGLTTDHVLLALADLDAGAEHPFGPPTAYELVRDGRRYAPKAVEPLRDGYIQRSGSPPIMTDPDRFVKWFGDQDPQMVHANNI